MKPSDICKQFGLDSLAELSRMSKVSTYTLINWFNRYPERFQLLLMGAAQKKKQTNQAKPGVQSHLKKHMTMIEEMLNSNHRAFSMSMVEADELVQQYCKYNDLMHESLYLSRKSGAREFKVTHK